MLSGKNIVIIGGTTGLGLSAALAFVKNGAKVVVIGRNQESCVKAQDRLNNNGLALRRDAMVEGSASQAFCMA